VKTQCHSDRGGRDKPGHDRIGRGSKTIESQALRFCHNSIFMI
jgi:hypothetical protein